MKSTIPARVAEVELIYRVHVKAQERPKITSAEDAYQILLAVWDVDRINLLEQFRVLLLDRSNRVMGQCLLFTGGISSTIVDPKLVFATALKCRASALIVAHYVA